MPYTVIVHIANEDALLAEMDELPLPGDNVVAFKNPRKRDGKPISQYDIEASIFYYPWTRVNFIEVLVERASRDELIEFFRDE